jgi:hypothetical protein
MNFKQRREMRTLVRKWKNGDVKDLLVQHPDRVFRDTPVKLLSEKRFSPLSVLPRDSIKWTFSYGPTGHEKPVCDYTEPITKVMSFNTFKCYYAEEFDGMQNAFIGAAGYTPPDQPKEIEDVFHFQLHG